MSTKSEPVPFRARRAPNPLDPRNNADAFEIRLLSRPSDISAALRLRYRSYADQGHLPPLADAEYRDAYDDLPTTALLGGFDQGRLVACMRVCFNLTGDDLAALPCAPHYPSLTSLTAKAPDGMAEVSRLAIDPGIGNTSYRTTLYGFMVRSAFASARAAGVTYIVVATRPEWVSTYKRLLAFNQIGEPAFYPPGRLPITLLAGRVDDAAKRVWMINRFFRVGDDDIARMNCMLAPVLAPRPPAVAAVSTR